MTEFDKEWGYTEKEGLRPLTEDEHNQLIEHRGSLRLRYSSQINHAQKLAELFRQGDDRVKPNAKLLVRVNGLKSLQFISDQIGFDVLLEKLHIGSEISNGWIAAVSDAEDLIARYPEHVRYMDQEDVEKEVLKIVSPHSWDPANISISFNG